MTKGELIEDMKRATGSAFITRKGLAQYMGKKDPHGVEHILFKLERVDKRYYFIPDVAEALLLLRDVQ